MPQYKLRWANRSQSKQDWQISNGDNFTLRADFFMPVRLTINNKYTFQIAVSTAGGFAAADLSYNAANQTWVLNIQTPSEWQLQVRNMIVTVRCFLESVWEEDSVGLQYEPSDPVQDHDA